MVSGLITIISPKSAKGSPKREEYLEEGSKIFADLLSSIRGLFFGPASSSSSESFCLENPRVLKIVSEYFREALQLLQSLQGADGAESAQNKFVERFLRVVAPEFKTCIDKLLGVFKPNSSSIPDSKIRKKIEQLNSGDSLDLEPDEMRNISCSFFVVKLLSEFSEIFHLILEVKNYGVQDFKKLLSMEEKLNQENVKQSEINCIMNSLSTIRMNISILKYSKPNEDNLKALFNSLVSNPA